MTDQTNNDSGSRRLRREEERRRQLDELIPRRPIEVSPVERSPVAPAPERSPVERGWREDLPEVGRFQERPVDPAARIPSRRELRERSAAGAGPATGAPQPSVDETWGARRAPGPEVPTPDPTPPVRPLSRRELRERAEGADSGPVRPRQEDAPTADAPPRLRDSSRYGSPQYDAGPFDAPRADAPRYDAPRYDAPRADAPRADAPQYDAPRADAPRAEPPQYDAPRAEPPYTGQAPSPAWEDPDRPIIQRERGEWSPREPVPNPADLETRGPARPAQPTRASNGEAHRPVRDEALMRPREPEPEQHPRAEDPGVDAPARVSPQARAAAIRAQAARMQAEQEYATRERYEQLQGQRAPASAQPEGQQAHAGPPPAAMWGQRPESNGAQPGTESEAANGYADRPPVRRVVLPPSMSAGTSPAEVPVLGQWQVQPQPQPQPQPHPSAVPPQQYQGMPQDGSMPANGQPFATVAMAPSGRGVTQTATAPARPATGGPGGPPNTDGSGPLPRWGSVGAGTAWSPTQSSAPNGQATGGPVSPTPAVGNGARSEDQDDDVAHRHPYTWLHMIVLVLVAFVLGMLIFMLVIEDTTANGAADVGQVTAATALATEQVGD